MSEFPGPRVSVSSMLQIITPLCPRLGCDGRMQPDSTMGLIPGTGLQVLRCPICKHRGYRSLEGLRVLFGTRHEHGCTYGPSIQSLTVVFSGAALGFFQKEGLCPTQSALYAAHWALLGGQLVGTLHLFAESPALVQCYTHSQREISAYLSDRTMGSFTAQECSFLQGATTGELTSEEATSFRNLRLGPD